MNGIVEVSIKEKKYSLKFGMQAFLIFQEKSAKSTLDADSMEGKLKSVCDLFFAGMTGNSIRNDKPVLPYSECVDLFDMLCVEPDFNDQVQKLWDCFNESIKPLTEIKETKAISKKKEKQSL